MPTALPLLSTNRTWPWRSSVGIAFLLIALGAQAQLPAIEVRFEPGCEMVKAYFNHNVANAVSYNWNFGDGTGSSLETPMHTFPFGASSTVTLTTVDNTGEAATFLEQFTTQEQLDFSQIELPNVFTPNGDGRNDEFAPLNERFLGPCAHLTIYNRYGQRMFESLGNDLSWDGRSFTGEPASDGVYFYVFTWGESALNSTVTLVR
ncbi:MAG: gliding motility-associated C-terminal domain-containing protein [Flavobacteriales bacterium]|nr:gliding motility-associated C-terminal domain-containing protein [Flavobacteriales bacterium]